MSDAHEVIASLSATDFPALLQRAREVAAHPARPDVVELRLDLLPGAWLTEAARDPRRLDPMRDLAREFGPRLVVACHGAEAFGRFEGDGRARVALLRAAAERGAALVDVHVDLADRFGEPVPGTRLIVSEHLVAGTPDDGELERRFARLRARAGPAGRIKLVTQAACAEDGLRLLLAGSSVTGPRSFFCSGAAGTFTRLFAPLVGSLATYASAGVATAPGQLDLDALRAAWPAGGPGPVTRALAVVGRPVAHSLSPRTHAAVQRACEVDAVFAAVEPSDFARFLELATRFAPLHGLAVTAPFKLDALRGAATREDLAERAGAANTLVRVGTTWRATNTDASAIATLARRVAPTARTALVLGAGGAARAACAALTESGLRLILSARRSDVAQGLAIEFGGETVDWGALDSVEASLVVQTTPLGGPQAPDGEPPLGPWRAGSALIEANYAAGPTPLARRARAAGGAVADGRDWFLTQARAQFEYFHGLRTTPMSWERAFEPATPAPDRTPPCPKPPFPSP
ncbi:type I 3-dehydroquinate dehydratase [Engelhardtia mirabilis]|uniref:Shikimate dehydrogenase n=1 Tax=Engelhardtia mirabilis TaxID=2528011 RepID=A0A518BMQ1_9BACT|nr:Shikimate dehydrogenase [Planctomycetes bacterium Pla133]QDV02542.1 Shikimate dehydrogenase [Planctomycetes bacterium Pla86]